MDLCLGGGGGEGGNEGREGAEAAKGLTGNILLIHVHAGQGAGSTHWDIASLLFMDLGVGWGAGGGAQRVGGGVLCGYSTVLQDVTGVHVQSAQCCYVRKSTCAWSSKGGGGTYSIQLPLLLQKLYDLAHLTHLFDLDPHCIQSSLQSPLEHSKGQSWLGNQARLL
jgi:hypothetical protein